MAYRWYNEDTDKFMKRGYLLPGQTIEERVEQVAERAAELLGLSWIKDKVIEAVGKGWMSLSTPIWCNFGLKRGLPISCFNTHISDTMESILHGVSEVGMMSKLGGGTSAYFSELRERGAPITNNGESSGAVHFMRLFESVTTTVSQGSSRRGSFAAYLDIEHPDILEFLSIKSEGSPIQHISFGVCVGNDWMRSMVAGDAYKRDIWAKVLQSRSEKGYPYIFFKDTVNNNTVDVYKDKGYRINSSNLCSEICLPSNEEESFVCDLASLNLLYYDEWKDTDLVETMTFLLDAVMTEFIEKAKTVKFMDRAVRFAERHRALGIGVLGWHSYLQKNSIPFESMQAKVINAKIFKQIKEQSYAASAKLAQIFGEPDVLKGYGRRNTTTMAVAPTTSSSFILGQVSAGVEPIMDNYVIKDLSKLKFTMINPILKNLLKQKGEDTPGVWESILVNSGSIQHLKFLSDHEKNVFKTFQEISQLEVVIQAAQRQQFIDQSQSLNLKIHPDVPAKDLNYLLVKGWEMGVKTFYYQHSVNAAQEFSKSILTCTSCEA